ncbi:roadblock/LC7 domain-containing protein [Thermomonospora cellulosilytica]|uniref:Putative regulator of Ras-like GTPase activity (Roadblock/LC7/MglB family) n=1 Tax=Thermomonospora cellulosilytica TaxID=1411118 RepID=A0A7W3MXY7_9ACTN|nr:roadblock/LC7 domain-containing protein [Thermomonospora cellulosilytica]MBA9003904.1 putative regulator of Ras-like GTPase activity (Roadblock/LC7/MglB family) [Thermomonospora cellulosilytica]
MRPHEEGQDTQMTGNGRQVRDPAEFGWLLNDFATGTPGVRHALIVSSDGLPLVVAGGMDADLADPLSAMSSGLLSLGHNIAAKVGQSGCEQIMLKFPAGHFLFMRIGPLAGLAVLVEEGANLGAVAYKMTQLVDGVGHLLTPQVRDDLRRLNLGQRAS